MMRLSKTVDDNPWSSACRHPEEFSIETVGGTEIEASELLASLVRCLKPRVVIETGTGGATTTTRLAAALSLNGEGMLYTLDIYERRTDYARARLAEADLLTFATPLTGDATDFDWAALLAGRLVDMAFIDGGVDRETEARRLLPLMRPGAFMAFHDTGNALTPARAVETLTGEGLLDAALFIPTPRGLTVTRTPGGAHA